MTYLVATVGAYTDPRHLALNRFESATISSEAVRESPDGFDLNTFVAVGSFDYPEEGEIRLELRVDAALAYHLQEARLSDDQELVVEGDGRMRLTATVRQTARLRWWILGLGTAVEVLGPSFLRAVIAEEIAELSARYGCR
jgi:predicted DNA-binding transcriptional regulator YafY